jgi:hypothetical protein
MSTNAAGSGGITAAKSLFLDQTYAAARAVLRPASGGSALRVRNFLATSERRGASRQEVVRLKQPHQLRGPFASLRHLSGISEREGLRQGLVER